MAASPLVGVAGVPVLDDVVIWDRLRRETYRGSFAEYAAFLKAHPDWPQATLLRRLAERAIDDSVPADARLDFFRQFPPLSATAKLRMAEALKASGRAAEAVTMARDAWDSAGLDALQETFLFTLFGNDLQPGDHLSRADRLLWSGQSSAASRLLPRLDVDHRLWLLARLALKANSPDAEVRLAAVPAALRDEPGLILDRAQWLRRRGDLAGARALLATTALAPGRVVDPEAWLKARLDFARAAWRAGDSETAYRIAATHQALPPGRGLGEHPLGARQQFVETEFLAGWLALRKLARPADALRHFQNLRAASLTPLSQARGDYWIGRAADAAGDRDAARIAWEAAAAHFDTFYGQLATERLGRVVALRRTPAPTLAPWQADTFRAESLVRAAFALGDLGDRGRQTLFLKTLAERSDDPTATALVAGLAAPLGRPDLGVLAGKNARGQGELSALDAAFPQLALPDSLADSATMIHAISRQESQFDRAALSPAGARGLMQLLPGTAAEQAGKLALPAATDRLTSDPVYNVTLGAGYFNRLLGAYGRNHVLAVAAYNAGPGNVRKIVAAIGDPRDGDTIDWIEAIPIAETRNYVQRVLENAVVYELLRGRPARLGHYLGK
ncbi:hypothetical protein IP88_01010 [alpha proteobacterium AAP81b]|nr:hypothetical protein IP88_01010 [alpha proteobacterium AAP81b]